MIIVLAIAQLVLVLLTPTFFCAGFYFGYNTAEDVLVKQMVELYIQKTGKIKI